MSDVSAIAAQQADGCFRTVCQRVTADSFGGGVDGPYGVDRDQTASMGDSNLLGSTEKARGADLLIVSDRTVEITTGYQSAGTRSWKVGLSLLVAQAAIVAVSCTVPTDAATRISKDIELMSGAFRDKSAGTRLRIVHQPRESPYGCSEDYDVTLQAGEPIAGKLGSLFVGCLGSSDYRDFGYSYSTTSHWSFVRVSQELRIRKAKNAPLTLVLEVREAGVYVVGLE
jgi:hypothetical protein